MAFCALPLNLLERRYVRRIVMTGLVATAAVLGSVVPAVSATAATRPAPATVARLASPAAGSAGTVSVAIDSIGDRISCASPTACLAVGMQTDSSGDQTAPVAEALHGTAWKSVAVKEPKGATDAALTGVSCKAATYCLAVGAYADQAGNTHPAAWTWNGTTLTLVTAPPMPSGSDLTALAAVSCVAVKSCVAIGSAFGSSGNGFQLIWTWNGRSWARKTATAGAKGTEAQVTAAHCFSLTSCVVAGTTTPVSGTTFTESLLLATWNGKAFTPQQAGAVSLDFGIVADVSCSSPAHCAMVGTNLGLSGKTTTMTGFAEVWNGTAWTATKWTGPKGATIAALFGVSCTTATSCVAVGLTGSQKTGHAAALSFNGTKWSVLTVPSAGSGIITAFEGVSCPKTGDCVAIGRYGKSNATAGKPLAGYWNGKAWRLKAA